MNRFLILMFTALLFSQTARCQLNQGTLRWQEGYLDIHHINTARGNATFFIFPDGTTMLFDAGDRQIPPGKEEEYFPATPHDSLAPGGWIAQYITQLGPGRRTPDVDYAVVSHFHDDHYGRIHGSSRWSTEGTYRLSGITEVGDRLRIGTLIDRGYPAYNEPVDALTFYKTDSTFTNYLAFLESQKKRNGLRVEQLVAGRSDQIILKYGPTIYPSFRVRNVKANHIIWSGHRNGTYQYQFNAPLVRDGEVDENALSLALKISYGKFDYFTGGDITGQTEWGDADLETAVARVVGRVEALALNHHGYRDATNAFFLRTLSPTVAIHQVIHDPHYQAGVLKRLAAHPMHVFTYNMHQTTQTTFSAEIAKLYQSTRGHVLIRVLPGGNQFWVGVLDDTNPKLMVKRWLGPYVAK